MDTQNEEVMRAKEILLRHQMAVVKDTGLAAVCLLALANLSLLLVGLVFDWPVPVMAGFLFGLFLGLLSLAITYCLAQLAVVAPVHSGAMSMELQLLLLLVPPICSAVFLFSGAWQAITLP